MASSAVAALSARRSPWLIFAITIAAVYFGKKLLIPLALAVLFAFLLTPVVKRLERWKIARVPAVLFVVLCCLSLAGSVGWVVANQLIYVVNQLPNYRDNIHRKIDAVRGDGGRLVQFTDSVHELSKELATKAPNQQPAQLPRHPSKSQKAARPPDASRTPLPVELVEPPPTALQSLRELLGPLLAPIGDGLIVVVFAAVILIRREDLRDRIFRLIGKGRLNVVTQAFDDATQRVSSYLRTQFVVNAAFGVFVSCGISLIGVPSAVLWGALAGLLRFVPYVGPVIGGGLPFVVALAVFSDWVHPLLALGLFLMTELTVGYVIEPWLYGAHTGISSLAILLAAAFWTMFWGPIGLVLSTPLTVCLVVLGRYVPQFEFLYVLLGDEPVLAPEAQFYQRLLAMDEHEARAVIETFLKEHSLVELYDMVFLPALSMAEADRHKGALDELRENFLLHSISEFLIELGEDASDPARRQNNSGRSLETPIGQPGGNASRIRVVCLPASDRADELAAAMAAQALDQAGYPGVSFPVSNSSPEIYQELFDSPDDIICISALPPFALLHARTLSKKLRARLPRSHIVVGLWSFNGGGARADERLGRAFDISVVTTLAQAVEQVHRFVDSGGEATTIGSESPLPLSSA